jgi:MFS family permease
MLIGQTLSALGDYAMFLALAVWVKDLTDSNAKAGLTFLPFVLPSLVGPALGVFVDRFPRRAVMITMDLAAAACLIPLLAVHGPRDVWLVYLVSFCLGVCTVVYQAARSGLLVGMLDEGELGEGNGLLQSTNAAMRLLAPLIGAAVFASAGGAAVAMLDAATFVVSALFLAAVHTRDIGRQEGGNFWPELRAGLAHIARTSVLLRLTLGTAFVMLLVGTMEVAIFALIDEGLQRPPEFLGPLMSVEGMGAIVAGMIVGTVIRRWGEVATIAVSAALGGVGLALDATAIVGLVFVGAAALGVTIAWFNTAYITLIQRQTALEMQGRVMAAADAAVTLPYVISIAVGAAIVTVVDYRVLFVAMAAGLFAAAIYFWSVGTSAERAEPVQAASIDGS